MLHHIYTSPSLWRPLASCVMSTSVAISDNNSTVTFVRGLPQFQIPLPSRQEPCLFVMKPTGNTVADLISSIKKEDKGVNYVSVKNKEGDHIAGSNTIETLLSQDFDLKINRESFSISPPTPDVSEYRDLDKLSDARGVVARLHSGLFADEHYMRTESILRAKLESLQVQLGPMEEERGKLATIAAARAQRMTWVGLGVVSLQFGLLARLTWWDYSWDVMEPVTYFLGCANLIGFYAYYVVTKKEAEYSEIFNRVYLKRFYRAADKQKFNVLAYNQLLEDINSVKEDLQRLRDPLILQLPLQAKLEDQVPKEIELH